eukprot:scaffold8831_cov135-Isochrysis_galbana.AAC.10
MRCSHQAVAVCRLAGRQAAAGSPRLSRSRSSNSIDDDRTSRSADHMTSPRAAPLAPEAPVLEPAELAPACIKLDLKDAPSGSANGLGCRGSPPNSTTGTTLTSSVNGSCTSLPLSTELAAPSEDGTKSSDHMSSNDVLEATRLPGYMEGFASGYARGRAAAMLENSSRRNPAVPDEMDPVDVSLPPQPPQIFRPLDSLAAHPRPHATPRLAACSGAARPTRC